MLISIYNYCKILFTEKQTHRHREQTVVAKGEGEGRGMDWGFGVHRCKLLHLEWLNNKVLIYSTGAILNVL